MTRKNGETQQASCQLKNLIFCLRLRDFFSLHFQNFEALVIKAESRHLQPRQGGLKHFFFLFCRCLLSNPDAPKRYGEKAFGAKAHPPFSSLRNSTPYINTLFLLISFPSRCLWRADQLSPHPASTSFAPCQSKAELASGLRITAGLRLCCRTSSRFLLRQRRDGQRKTSPDGDAEAIEERLLDLSNAEVVPAEVVAGTEIPGGGRRGRLYLTRRCHHHNQ